MNDKHNPKKEVEIFRRNLRYLMFRSDLSLRDMEKVVGINRQSLNTYLHGEARIPLAEAWILSKYFQRGLEEMMTVDIHDKEVSKR